MKKQNPETTHDENSFSSEFKVMFGIVKCRSDCACYISRNVFTGEPEEDCISPYRFIYVFCSGEMRDCELFRMKSGISKWDSCSDEEKQKMLKNQRELCYEQYGMDDSEYEQLKKMYIVPPSLSHYIYIIPLPGRDNKDASASGHFVSK